MDGGNRAGRNVQHLIGFGLHHLADALRFALGDGRQPGQMTLHVFDGLGEIFADLRRFGVHLARSPQQLLALRHRFADQGAGVLLGLGRAFADQGLRAAARIAQGRDQVGQHDVGVVGGFLQPLRFLREGGGELRGAAGGAAHDAFQMPFGLACHGLEALGFLAQCADGDLHAAALLLQGGFKLGAVFLQFAQHVGHRGAMLFLPRQDEFRALERGVGNRLDLLGLGVEFDRGGMRRFAGSLGRGAKARRLNIQRLRRHLERAFRRLDRRFQLRRTARHGLGGARRGVGQGLGNRFQPLAFLAEAGGDRFAAHFGACARIVQGDDLVLQCRL